MPPANRTFGRAFSLKSNRQIRELVRHRRGYRTSNFVATWQPRESPPEHLRVAIITGRRLGHAAHRNRAKRQLREWLRLSDLRHVQADLVIRVTRLPLAGTTSQADLLASRDWAQQKGLL